MVATCIYRGLAKRRVDRVYLLCLPFGYVGVFLLLFFGTGLSVSSACWITVFTGDAPGAMLAGIIAGSLALAAKSEDPSECTVTKSAGACSADAAKDQ